jgi:uncharacterized protein (DUF488 family)
LNLGLFFTVAHSIDDFAVNTLNNLLPKVGIDYIHIPQLGIESNKRQDLDSQESYKKLFDEYVIFSG